MSRRHSNVEIQKQVIVISLVMEFNCEYLTISYLILTLFFYYFRQSDRWYLSNIKFQVIW